MAEKRRYIFKNMICKRCGQLFMFENCSNEVSVYNHFVCWDCLKKDFTPCHSCGEWYTKVDRRLKEVEEEEEIKVCKVCLEDEAEYCTCKQCKKNFNIEKCTEVESVDGFVCEGCFSRHFRECSFCNGYYHRDRMREDENGNYACDECDVISCAQCYGFMRVDSDIHWVEEEAYCMNCYEYSFRLCDFCEEVFNRDNLFMFDGNQYCYDCGMSRDLPFQHNGRLIRQYHTRPPIKFYTLKGEKDRMKYGIELEVENVKESISNDVMSEKCWRIVRDFCWYNTDGSIRNGFEIITQPFTWGWYKENREIFVKLLSELRSNGFESYNPGTCGIHIHMSKEGFISDIHLFKFLKIFYDNYEFLKAISQRDSKSTCGGCQWGGKRERNDNLIDKAKAKRGFERYTAANLENENTVEIRIFRGTLKEESFFKNIEFVRSCVEFSSVTGVKDINVEKFVEFVGNERKSYGNLWGFLEKKWEG